MSVRTVFGCALVSWCVAFTSPGAAGAGERLYFDVDPTQSVLQSTTTLNFLDLGLVVTTVGQGRRGLGEPGFSTGRSGQLDGVLAANVDFDAGTMKFGGGGMYGLPSGIWEPLPQGEHGIAPAFLGIMILDVGGVPTRAVAAVRDFWLDYADQYSITSLTDLGSGNYGFATDEWISVSTKLDFEGQSGLGLLIDPVRFDLEERYAAQNIAGQGSLSMGASGGWDLRVPINTSVLTSVDDVEGIGRINVSLQVAGQIVGHSFQLAEPTIVRANPDNDSLATAQSLDAEFRSGFDPNIGESLVNISAAMPHLTIDAEADGTPDYYRFHVSAANAVGIFDIDGASFDTRLLLYDALGRLIASNDDASSTLGALGSLSSNDAFIEYAFAAPGEYTLAVVPFAQPGPTLAASDSSPGGYRLGVALSTAVVPEPASWFLATMGFALVFAARRRGWLRRVLCGVVCTLVLGASGVEAASLHTKDSVENVFDRDGVFPMPYRLFVPSGAESSAEQLPLVLFLHGSGERGVDNYDQLNHIDGLINATQGDRYRAFLLAPQMTDFPFAGGWTPTSSYDRTLEILADVLATYPVDPHRIYITGLSMGGFGTFEYLAERPDLFAAAVPMSGGGSILDAPTIKDIPLWVFHGTLDDVVPVTYSRGMVNAIRNAGGSPLFTEIPNGGHDIWDPVYNDAELNQYGLYDWMFAQSKASAQLVAAVPEPSSLVLAAIAGVLLLTGRGRRWCRR
ncbi:MAG: DVUA0089 family protein [Pirellulales bacterium]|nr:DVUA0089 family protein [Pirellulales bacterium]